MIGAPPTDALMSLHGLLTDRDFCIALTEILGPLLQSILVGWAVESPWLEPAAAHSCVTINGHLSAYMNPVMIISAIRPCASRETGSGGRGR